MVSKKSTLHNSVLLKYHLFTSHNEKLKICVGANKNKSSKWEKLQGIKNGSKVNFKYCIDDIGKTWGNCFEDYPESKATYEY